MTVAVLAAGASSSLTQPLAAQRRPIEIDDLFRMKSVGGLAISPDGRWVLYTVTTTDPEEDTRETRVWIAAMDGSESRPMTAPASSASDPAFSPDGRYISFLASRGEDAETQVWLLDRRGGEAEPLTAVEQGVSDYGWSPDGKRLLLSIRDKAEQDTAWSDLRAPWVIDRLQFKRDGTGYLTGDRHTHLYVFEVARRELWQLTGGRWDEGQPVWRPDGGAIAFVSNRTEDPDTNDDSDIWIVDAVRPDTSSDVSGGERFHRATYPPLRRVTTNPGADFSPAWSPDGRSIAYVTVTQPELIWYATNHLAVIASDGSGARMLTRALDRNVGSPRWSTDGRSVWFELEESAEDHLARVDVRSGRIERPVSGPLSLSSFALARGGQLAALVQKIDRPGEIYAVAGGELRQLSHANDSLLAVLQLGPVLDETFASEDGTEIEAFFYLPPDHTEGTRHPALLRIHGGPVAQFTHRFTFEARLFAANGYVVVNVNPRGSSGYGQAFSHAIWADWGNKDFDDVMAGIDHAIARGWADPDRLGVGGWSYGGILTDHVITKTDRFKAAITGASEVLYIANYGHDHYQREWVAELGLPWESREKWERISPFNYVERVVTPTLVMGGERDWNVPIQNSEQLYQALRRRGVPTQLIVYPGQSHGIGPVAYRRDRYERYLAWYGKWIR